MGEGGPTAPWAPPEPSPECNPLPFGHLSPLRWAAHTWASYTAIRGLGETDYSYPIVCQHKKRPKL